MEKVGEIITSIINGLIGSIYEWLVKPFLDLKSFEELIFGRDGDKQLAYGIFTAEEIENIYLPGMYVMGSLAAFFFILGVVFAGKKIASAGINPANRTYFIQFGLDLLFVSIVLFNLNTIYSLIFSFNYNIVQIFDFRPENQLFTWDATIPEGDDILGMIVINLMVLGLGIWGNFYYMMRKVTLMVLLILGPLMVVLYMIPKLKGITAGWFKELTGTVMVQSIHAFLYWITAGMTMSSSGLESVILYLVFIPTAEMLRSLFGLGGGMHSKLSSVGAMFGMSAISGMYGAFQAAKGNKSVMEALRDVYKGKKDGKNATGDNEDSNLKNVVGANTGTDTGTTSLAEKMLKPGEITSKMGKAVAGMAGSIAGSPMGPIGSITGSTIGFEAGGIAGGLAGRVGAAGTSFVANRLGKGLKDGIASAKGIWNADKANDEKLAKELAKAETSKWASDNKEQFYKDMKEKFPDVDSQSLDAMWNQKLNDKQKQFYNDAKKAVASIKKNDGTFANASQLADVATEKFTADWAKNNKEEFMKAYDRNNPIHPNMSKEELAKREQDKQEAWNNAVNEKRQQYQEMAKSTAEQLSNGVPLSSSFIKKDDFAKGMAEKALNHDKQDFIANYKKNNPQLSDQEIELEYMKKHGNKQKQYIEMATNAVNGSSSNNAADLVTHTTENMVNQWANQNKATFTKNYKQQNPEATEQDIEVAWKNAVNGKQKEFLQVSQDTAKAMTQSNDLSGVQIDRSAFAVQVGKNLFNQEKQQFIQHVKKNGQPNNDQIELAFEDKHGGAKVYLEKARSAVSGISGPKLYSGTDVNTEYLASQLAYVKTQNARDAFLKESMDEEQAMIQWQADEGNVYKQNLQAVSQTMPKYIPLDKVKVPNAVLRGATAIGAGVVSGVAGASGIKEISSFIQDTKIGRAASAGLMGATVGFKESLVNASGSLTTRAVDPIISGVSNAMKEIKVSWQTPHPVENPMEKQQNFKNAIAYSFGVLGGVSAYQKGAKLGMKFNPWNNAVQQQTFEVSEIEHMVQKVDVGNGEMAVANGAIRLVTTQNESYIQVRDRAGNTRIVSRFGSGDSSLNKGEIIYQDLDIQNGALIHSSQPYRLDSGGGKVQVNRSLNINPNKLVANRNSIDNPVTFDEMPAFNQQVDSGQFYTEDIINQTKNIRMRITHNRSYLVAEDVNGNEIRVSPYGKGDPRIEKGEVREIHCTVKNRRIIKDVIKNQDNKEVEYHTSLSPNDLVPTKVNKRLAQRRELEAIRHRTLGGAI